MTYSDVKKFVTSWRGMCILAVLVLAVLICVPAWQVERVRARLDKPDAYQLASLEDEYRRTLAQILAGCGLLVGLYWTSRRVKATEDNVSVGQEGQITERFTRAIEQLGAEEMAIRLGGIYALERLAKDSEKDHGPIMEVLTAYVRENAPIQEEDTPEALGTPPTDIQAILTVIGRRKTTDDNRRNELLDLRATQLVRTTLVGADLSQAILYRANLSEANLDGAILSGAILVGANLYQATLSGANLHGAELEGANLYGAKLHGAKLHGADLRGAYNLTAEQVQTAQNWREAILPKDLPDLPDFPDPPGPPPRDYV